MTRQYQTGIFVLLFVVLLLYKQWHFFLNFASHDQFDARPLPHTIRVKQGQNVHKTAKERRTDRETNIKTDSQTKRQKEKATTSTR